MVDYEIEGYIVEFRRAHTSPTFTKKFGCEEDAVDFIERYRHNWCDYRLIQIRVAII